MTLDELRVSAAPERWSAAGFRVEERAVHVGAVRLLLGELPGERGIVSCTVRGLASERPDGLPMLPSEAPPREPGTDHPNGVVALDHLVVVAPFLDRTTENLTQAGLDLRRVRDEPAPGGAPRQAFFRLGEVILEVAESPPAHRHSDAAPRFWGLAFSVEDLDRSAVHLGRLLGEVRDAVQPGRRIATIRKEAGLGVAVALMSRARGVRPGASD